MKEKPKNLGKVKEQTKNIKEENKKLIDYIEKLERETKQLAEKHEKYNKLKDTLEELKKFNVKENKETFQTKWKELTSSLASSKKVLNVKLEGKYNKGKLTVSSTGIGTQGSYKKTANYQNFNPKWVKKVIKNRDKIKEHLKENRKDYWNEVIDKIEEKIDLEAIENEIKNSGGDLVTLNSISYNRWKIKNQKTIHEKGTNSKVSLEEKKYGNLCINHKGKLGRSNAWKNLKLENFVKSYYNLPINKIYKEVKKCLTVAKGEELRELVRILKDFTKVNEVVEEL